MTTSPLIHRAPLVVMLAAGAALFAVVSLWPDRDPCPTLVEVTAEDLVLEQLRDPSLSSADDALRAIVRRELLINEAVARGLHLTDPTVRRRLIRLMDWLVWSHVTADEPDDDTLRAWYATHGAALRPEARYTFRHILLSRQTRGPLPELDPARAASDASATLVDGRTASQLTDIWGAPFVAALADLEPGTWSGPLRSAVGTHLVQLIVLERPEVPPFEEARDLALDRWYDEANRAARATAWRDAARRYTITVDGQRYTPPTGGTP